jgi:hypothetical protein
MLLLGITPPSPSSCDKGPTTWISSLGPITNNEAICNLPTQYSLWDPWGNQQFDECPASVFKVTLGTDHFTIRAPAPASCSLMNCTQNMIDWVVLTPNSETSLSLSVATDDSLSGGDYIACACDNRIEYHSLVKKVSETVHERILKSKPSKPNDGWNVVYLMIDAVSRAHFQRALPRTVSIFFSLKNLITSLNELFNRCTKSNQTKQNKTKQQKKWTNLLLYSFSFFCFWANPNFF